MTKETSDYYEDATGNINSKNITFVDKKINPYVKKMNPYMKTNIDGIFRNLQLPKLDLKNKGLKDIDFKYLINKLIEKSDKDPSFNFRNFKDIDLSGNPLLRDYSSLRRIFNFKLNISNNKLTNIPKSLIGLNITELDLSNNKYILDYTNLSQIPAYTLNLSNNDLKSIPFSIKDMRQLRELYLDDNYDINFYTDLSWDKIPKQIKNISIVGINISKIKREHLVNIDNIRIQNVYPDQNYLPVKCYWLSENQSFNDGYKSEFYPQKFDSIMSRINGSKKRDAIDLSGLNLNQKEFDFALGEIYKKYGKYVFKIFVSHVDNLSTDNAQVFFGRERVKFEYK